ncbi:MAG: homoserine dehydrogenase [Oscillospiraceae bacterium]|nr:homoserine dehydrogenase [Oscillospiraceae bacterium]
MIVGLLGYGVVGSGIHEFLLTDKARHDISVKRILERTAHDSIAAIRVGDPQDIIADPEIDTVIEVLGGFEPASSIALAAVEAGKNLITANKLMLAENYVNIIRAARQRGVSVAYSATVGGGIPYLKNLALVSRADTVVEVGGICNGTTNFILDQMQSNGADFTDVLAEAQRLGYAETDPTADIDAVDLCCKLTLLCNVGFNAYILPADIPTFGVRHITKSDIDVFKASGLRVRLVGHAVRNGNGVAAYCQPTLFAPGDGEYSVYGVENYIHYTGERTGKHTFGGQGAGRETTAVNVYLDAIDILHGFSPFDKITTDEQLTPCFDGVEYAYYLRTAAPLPQGVTIQARFGEGMYLTAPLCVTEMHRIYGELAKTDPNTFVAAWK